MLSASPWLMKCRIAAHKLDKPSFQVVWIQFIAWFLMVILILSRSCRTFRRASQWDCSLLDLQRALLILWTHWRGSSRLVQAFLPVTISVHFPFFSSVIHADVQHSPPWLCTQYNLNTAIKIWIKAQFKLDFFVVVEGKILRKLLHVKFQLSTARCSGWNFCYG